MTKKILFLSIFITSVLFSNEAITSYDQALKLFKEKNYQEAYSLFSSLSKHDLENQYLNYYLGRCAYELKEYDLAISYYDRILFAQPNNLRAKIETAQSNLMLKNYTQAIKYFNAVLLDENTPQDIKKSIESKLTYINTTMQKHFISGAVIFDMSYDSNVNNAATAGDYSIFVPQLGTDLTLSNSEKEESDFYYDAIAVVNHIYKYNEEFSLNNTLLFYTQDYNDKKNSNINLVSLSSTPTFYQGVDKYSMGIGMDYIQFNDKDYIKNYNVIFAHSHIFSQNRLNAMTLKMSKKEYVQKEDEAKSAHIFTLSNSLKQKTENYGLFTFNTSYSKELEIKETRTDVSKESFVLGLEHSLALPYEYNLSTSLEHKKVIYADTDVNFLTRRVDEINTLSLGITKPLRKNLLFALKGTLTNNNSNQAPFDYKKQIIKSSLIYTF